MNLKDLALHFIRKLPLVPRSRFVKFSRFEPRYVHILHRCMHIYIYSICMSIHIYSCTVLCMSYSVFCSHYCCKEIVWTIPIYTHTFTECPPQLTKKPRGKKRKTAALHKKRKKNTCSKTHWIGPGSACRKSPRKLKKHHFSMHSCWEIDLFQ